ncbi:MULTISPECIES: DUF4440 domain-containing protein [Dyella]|uniref:DUF4440 domain-containing protein n=2 Tax=Dyella TaxID=231454 RepID=A0A4V2NM42_9GAMM|nr:MULTISPECIES: DUF4440 domain-containing protein [Dyella]TBR40561.1 DUF4440 domain-containing protein [Dyella terrae]TCI11857.1 DUF4440 domain-containing protein [Dyella soli]
MRQLIPALATLGLLLGASPVLAQGNPGPVASAVLPDVALPPELDRVLRDYERAWNAADASALAALFADDGIVLQSQHLPARGRAAITAAYAHQGGGGLRLRAFAYATSDTVGFITGGYGFGDKPGDAGKFTLTLRRTSGGRWLIFSDMDNLNASPRVLNAAGGS